MEGTQFQFMVWEPRSHAAWCGQKLKTNTRLRTGRGGGLWSPLTSLGHIGCSDGFQDLRPSNWEAVNASPLSVFCLFHRKRTNPRSLPAGAPGPARAITASPLTLHPQCSVGIPSTIQAQGCRSRCYRHSRNFEDEQSRRLQPWRVSSVALGRCRAERGQFMLLLGKARHATTCQRPVLLGPLAFHQATDCQGVRPKSRSFQSSE